MFKHLTINTTFWHEFCSSSNKFFTIFTGKSHLNLNQLRKICTSWCSKTQTRYRLLQVKRAFPVCKKDPKNKDTRSNQNKIITIRIIIRMMKYNDITGNELSYITQLPRDLKRFMNSKQNVKSSFQVHLNGLCLLPDLLLLLLSYHPLVVKIEMSCRIFNISGFQINTVKQHHLFIQHNLTQLHHQIMIQQLKETLCR